MISVNNVEICLGEYSKYIDAKKLFEEISFEIDVLSVDEYKLLRDSIDERKRNMRR